MRDSYKLLIDDEINIPKKREEKNIFIPATLFYASLLGIKLIYVYDPQISSNLINFYRGSIFLILSYLHIHMEKIDLSDEKNFQRINFRTIIYRSLCNNISYISFISAIKYLNLLNFLSFYSTFFYVLLFVRNSIYSTHTVRLNQIIFILISLVLVIIILPFKKCLDGIIFLILFYIFYFIVIKIFDEKLKFSTNYYISCLFTNIMSILFSPLLICLEKGNNLINFYSTLAVLGTSIVMFYFIKILNFTYVKSGSEGFLYSYSYIVFTCFISVSLIVYSLIPEITHYIDLLSVIGLVILFLVKHNNILN